MLRYPIHTPLTAPFNGSHRRRTSRNEMLNSILSQGFPYSSKLSAHTSCVNALTFSSGDGRFLASAGDDHKICIWDFHSENVTTPSHTLPGPGVGVAFALAFSATNRRLYLGGTQARLLTFDISTLGSPIDERTTRDPDANFSDCGDTIRDITAHPYQEEIFLTAGQDGRILLHDSRVRGRFFKAQHTLQFSSEATGVQHHPNMEHIFATSDSFGRVCLRDTRMAFGPSRTRTRQGIVQSYNTKLSRGGTANLSNPEANSITFDREGTKLAVTMLHHLPTIYGLSDPNPLAVCSGKRQPDGTLITPPQRSYANSCTMKRGAFGSAGFDSEQFFSAGSEDFRAYIWKIPPLQQLKDSRIEVSFDDWATGEWLDTVAFTQGIKEPRFIPVDISIPFCLLTGHKSIVNSTLFHPHLPHIVTSGIERDIIIHSPTAASPCVPNLERTSTDIRPLTDYTTSSEAYFRLFVGSDSDNSEMTTIHTFDQIIMDEGDVDVFSARMLTESPGSSDDEMDDSSDN